MPDPLFGFVASWKYFHDVGKDDPVAIEELIAPSVKDFAGALMQRSGDSLIGGNRKIGGGAAIMLDRVFPEKRTERLSTGSHLGLHLFG